MGLDAATLDPNSRTHVTGQYAAEQLAIKQQAGQGQKTSGKSGDSEAPSAENPNGEPMVYVAAPGHGSGCGHCTGQARMLPKSKAEAAKKERNAKALAEVWAHEMAHAGAAGKLGGAPRVWQDPETGATGGEVPVNIPSVNEKDPEQSYEDGKIIVAAAMAPNDPSSQDYAVAAQGAALQSESQSAKSELASKMAQAERDGGVDENLSRSNAHTGNV